MYQTGAIAPLPCRKFRNTTTVRTGSRQTASSHQTASTCEGKKAPTKAIDQLRHPILVHKYLRGTADFHERSCQTVPNNSTSLPLPLTVNNTTRLDDCAIDRHQKQSTEWRVHLARQRNLTIASASFDTDQSSGRNPAIAQRRLAVNCTTKSFCSCFA